MAQSSPIETLASDAIPPAPVRVHERFDGQVLEVVLGRPPANIVTIEVIEELARALDRVVGDRHVKLIVLAGEGKHFSFGASVEEHTPGRVGEMLPLFHAVIRQLLACPIPTLAKVEGLCLGGGFELALGCSLLFADERAKLGVPELKLGVFPPPASALLPARAGEAAAAEIILTADTFTAETMHRMGVVNRVAPHGDLDALVDAFVEEHIVLKSASSLRIAHRALRMPLLAAFDTHIQTLEDLYLDELMQTGDAVEGIEAFLERREPVFQDA